MRRRFSGYDIMRQIHGTIGSKIMNFRQIKALQRPGMAFGIASQSLQQFSKPFPEISHVKLEKNR